jgi:hypothetical protein
MNEADSSYRGAEMQRARGLTEKHNSVSKRLHNLPAIAPRLDCRNVVLCRRSYIYASGNTDAIYEAQSTLPKII